jgi:hypothetical protein
MAEDKDWRLTNQESYLIGVSLIHRRYAPAAGNDHDHCSFCWDKFMAEGYPDVLHDGYATIDSSHWICDQCFHDFRERFRWQLISDAAPPI